MNPALPLWRVYVMNDMADGRHLTCPALVHFHRHKQRRFRCTSLHVALCLDFRASNTHIREDFLSSPLLDTPQSLGHWASLCRLGR